MTLNELRLDLSKRTKRGLPFILASVFIWIFVLIIWLLRIEDPITKNLLTFCVVTPLMPMAYFISRIIKAEFSIKDNPLSKLGLLFSFNQFLYILIAMWIYNAVPEKMVMVLAMIFGAHLLPFGWLYQSKAYTVLSVFISFAALIVGLLYSAIVVSTMMICIEIIFTVWLVVECKNA